MAAANKPGALHYAFIVTFLIVVVLGITNYSWYKEYSDRSSKIAELTDTNQKITAANNTNMDRIETLKKMLGIKFAEFGDPAQDNPASVVTALKNDLKTYGATEEGPTVQATLQQMRQALAAAMADRDSKAAKIVALEAEVRGLKGQYQAQVDTFVNDSKSHEQAKLDAVAEFNGKIAEKATKIAEQGAQLSSVRSELAQIEEQAAAAKKKGDSKIVQLEQQIDFLRDKIDDLEKMSFEAPKGLITNVEYSTNTVLLNVGEADFVRPRMTFSVYSKDIPGVGRSVEDIKAKLEVISVPGPHMSVAKVMDEDLTRPIVAQDLIYTPIWNPGLKEKISIIGFIDLDGDGRSDRDQLHQLLATAGCEIDNEVDDEGFRHPENGQLSVLTRFLVKGTTPDKLEAQTPEEQAKAERFAKLEKEMRQEARENGVRVVKLNDFLAYVGFHNKRRIYLSGENSKFNLKNAATSSIDNGGSKDRTSNGNTSKLFDKKGRKGPQQESSGTTSQSAGGSSSK